MCQGFDVTYITRLNAPDKPAFKQLGQRCRIHRVPVGPPRELSPGEVGAMIDELEIATRPILCGQASGVTVLHSQYWIAGEVCRRINRPLGLRHIHHMLSFGRQKRSLGEEARPTDALRDACEQTVFDAVDLLVAQCPSEARDLLTLYPELGHRRIVVIPHGVDPDVFTP
ncbi:glycosyltransferase [Azospirillum argentinense]|uniref:Glycosyltransferase n=1 Tax=Azospirillum argentinense TaxID=2970906 RepID=A0ABW8VL73_9PROT